jgi:phospholipid/cholesterol/gamma-HCH transport system substrate-binding protein
MVTVIPHRRRLALATAAALVLLLVAASAFVVQHTWLGPKTVTAYFTTATSIYPGDDVRVAGVKAGRVTAIEPQGTSTKLTLAVDHGVQISADAKAVLVAPNLIAARYIQLAPAYQSTGPTMPDGAVIPVERTAIPVEWDQVKEQLTRLATELGPNANVSTPSVSRFIDSAANALGGNGDKLRQTLSQLSTVGRILATGGGDIVDTIKNLQVFVTALRDSKDQIVQFQGRLTTLTSVLNGSRSDLDAALKNLSDAVGEVQRFIAGTRDATAEQVQRLANVTQNLVDHRMDLEQILHVAPTALVNFYNIFDPRTGAAAGEFLLNNFSDSKQAICGMIGALGNVTAPETGKLCGLYTAPALDRLNINSIPVPFDPFLYSKPPWQDLIYSEARLQPGGEGPKPQPPDQPPSVSAYTGLPGDTPGSDWPPIPGAAPFSPAAGPETPAPAPDAPPPPQGPTS